jgi:hypothetical protein
MKPAGSILIGTSPEFDFALYTFCFLTRRLNGNGRICNVCLFIYFKKFINFIDIPKRSLSKLLILKKNNFKFEIDGCKLNIISYELVQNDRPYIGSMYPGAGQMTEECRFGRN